MLKACWASDLGLLTPFPLPHFFPVGLSTHEQSQVSALWKCGCVNSMTCPNSSKKSQARDTLASMLFLQISRRILAPSEFLPLMSLLPGAHLPYLGCGLFPLRCFLRHSRPVYPATSPLHCVPVWPLSISTLPYMLIQVSTVFLYQSSDLGGQEFCIIFNYCPMSIMNSVDTYWININEYKVLFIESGCNCAVLAGGELVMWTRLVFNSCLPVLKVQNYRHVAPSPPINIMLY